MKKKQFRNLIASEIKLGDVVFFKSGRNFRRNTFYETKYSRITGIDTELNRIFLSCNRWCSFEFAETNLSVVTNSKLADFLSFFEASKCPKRRTRRPLEITNDD